MSPTCSNLCTPMASASPAPADVETPVRTTVRPGRAMTQSVDPKA